jgi:hypothetical protein
MVMRASAQIERVADAASAPITIRRRRQAPVGGFLLVVAGVWIAVPLRRLLLEISAAVPGPGVAGAIGAFVIGVALALLALSWIVRCELWVIDQGLVRMSDRRLRGTRFWADSLARYRGVRHRREQRSHRYGSRSWYVVEAWHPEPAKTIELARSKDPRLVGREAKIWARRLALPLCQEHDQAPARSES